MRTNLERHGFTRVPAVTRISRWFPAFGRRGPAAMRSVEGAHAYIALTVHPGNLSNKSQVSLGYAWGKGHRANGSRPLDDRPSKTSAKCGRGDSVGSAACGAISRRPRGNRAARSAAFRRRPEPAIHAGREPGEMA